MRRLLIGLVAAGLVLTACSGAKSQQASDQRPAPTERPSATLAAGTVRIQDRLATLDLLTVEVENLPAPASGRAYQVWLRSVDGTDLISAGLLRLRPDGSAQHEWSAPTSQNLLERYAALQITAEPAAGSPAPTGPPILSGSLTPPELGRLRSLFVRNNAEPKTPGNTAYALGLRTQIGTAIQHATIATNAHAVGSLGSMANHLEHVINILVGPGPHFGDHDGNGVAEDPGDGFGVQPYSRETGLGAAGSPQAVSALNSLTTAVALARSKATEAIGARELRTAAAPLGELRLALDQVKAASDQLYAAAQATIRFELKSGS